MPAKKKKAVWGPHRLSVTSGQALDDTSAAAGADAVEPVCYHGLPMAFFKEVFEAHSVNGICDLTVGGATATEAALALKLPYFGICPTEVHAMKTMDFLAERMMSMMADQTSNFYDPEMVKASEGPTQPTPKPTPRPSLPAFPKDVQL